MKRLFLAALCAASLSACAPLAGGPAASASDVQASLLVNWYRACLTYNGMQPTIAQKVATLPKDSATQLLIASNQAARVCSQTPTDLNSAVASITSAVTTISILTAVQQVNK